MRLPPVQAEQVELRQWIESVVSDADGKRYPCQLQRHKPVALKEYAPRFDETYAWALPRS